MEFKARAPDKWGSVGCVAGSWVGKPGVIHEPWLGSTATGNWDWIPEEHKYRKHYSQAPVAFAWIHYHVNEQTFVYRDNKGYTLD